jgi:hypothetical protein
LIVLALRRRRVEPPVNRTSLFMLGLLGACLCASLAYQVTLAQIVYGKPMTNGWYLYCLVFAEIVLVCAGWMAILPRRGRVLAPAGLAGLFVALDLYGMNFVLIPYYLGWIVHSAGGRLQAFHLGQLWNLSLPEISARILLNRPYFGAAGEFAALWVLYLAATAACLAVAVMQARPDPSTAEASRRR